MKEIGPLNYRLEIVPDLSNFTFSASATITLQAPEPVDEIALNVLELAVWRCALIQDGQCVPCSFAVDSQKELLRVQTPGQPHGEILLKIDYEGKINDRMAGFYRSLYMEDGRKKHIAVTQFQESDARRALPCLDHPGKKASFDIEMVVDRDLRAVSNEIAVEEKNRGDGKKTVRFRRTPRMSTYLVFMGLGDFDLVRDEKDPRVRVLTLPRMTRHGVYGARFARMSLGYCERYFQIPYPLPKMDLIAVPDFAFGAMENWGAITFRENLLLHYPGTTSKAGEQRICEVIAHEIVHQWFGNLVTPSDWKYLWLNESFATYFSYRIVDSFHPEWDAWGQFLNGQTDSAMSRDQLKVDQAIEIPGGEHVVINTSTAPIIYSKGGSILRQVEGYVGEEAFRRGLNLYLTGHAYGNAASEDLWNALEEASYKPVTAMMKNWVEQPGYPVVEVDRIDDVLVFVQKRHTCPPAPSEQTWLVPLSARLYFRDGKSKRVEMLMDGRKAHIDTGGDVVAYKVNDGQTGFYRVKYLNTDDFRSLGGLVEEKKMEARDRWGVQNDLYAFVKAGATRPGDYLKFLERYAGEDAFLPLTSIAANLHHAYVVLKDAERETVGRFGCRFLGGVLSRIGLEPSPDEPATTSILRDQVLWHACVYGDPGAGDFLLEKFSGLLKGKDVHPDIMKSVLQAAALMENRRAMEWMKKRFAESESEHERMNILAGVSCFKDPDLILEALRFTLEEVPDRNKFMPVAMMGENPHAETLLWDWFVENLAELEKMHPLHFERVIVGAAPVAGLEKAPEVEDFLAGYMVKNEKARDAARLAIEKLRINLGMRGA